MPQTSLREVHILRRLCHPNVVELVEVVVGSKADSIFLVFEYCTFELAQLIDSLQTPFILPEVKCIMQQLLSAVSHLHANGVMHRDIKLSNLLLSSAGELRLCDFGLAREHYGPMTSSGAGAVDRHGNLYDGTGKYTPRVVTLWYRAPELLLGATRYGLGVDMWSIGCVLGELLLNRPLLPADSEPKQLILICELLGTPSKQIWPEVEELPLWRQLHGGLPDQPYNELPTRLAKARPAQSTLDLLNSLLTYDPSRRMDASAALTHRWLTSDHPPPSKTVASVVAIAAQRERATAARRSSSSGAVGGGGGIFGGASGSSSSSRGLKRPLAESSSAAAASASGGAGGSGGASAAGGRHGSVGGSMRPAVPLFSAPRGTALAQLASSSSSGASSSRLAPARQQEHADLSGSARIPSPDGVMTTTARQC